MEVDNVIAGHIIKIQKDLKTIYKIDLTEKEILAIIETQFEMTVEAMKNDRPVKINYLGGFRIKKGKAGILATIKELNEEGIIGERREEIMVARAELFLGPLRKVKSKEEQLKEIIDNGRTI